MHHKNPSRDGVFVQPSFSQSAVATLHVDSGFSATLPMVNGNAQAPYKTAVEGAIRLAITQSFSTEITRSSYWRVQSAGAAL